jgi:hypothetical protein
MSVPADTSLFCSSCGTRCAPDARFCRSCGADTGADAGELATDVISGWAAPTVALPSLPVAAAGPQRSRWVLPVIAGSALLVGAAAVVLILAFSGGTTTAPFAEQASGSMAPVVASDEALSQRLAAVQGGGDLVSVSEAATAAADVLGSARGAIGVLATGSNATRGAALQNALAADLAYVTAVKAAAKQLTPGRASASVTAGQQAGQAYQDAAPLTPTLTVPAASAYLPAQQLVTLAEQLKTAEQAAKQKAQRAAQQKDSATTAIGTYLRSIDSLLRNSADTRSNLGTLIGQVQSGQLDAAQATSTIAGVINQRQDLQNQASALPAPAAFRTTADLLRQSIAASLQDDYAIQSWINAWYSNDQTGFDRAYSQHLQATAQASRAKATFLAAYNPLRSRYLHLTPLDVAY